MTFALAWGVSPSSISVGTRSATLLKDFTMAMMLGALASFCKEKGNKRGGQEREGRKM